MFQLKNYQKEAVKELSSRIMAMAKKEHQLCVFEAPTGSGKTVITAELLRDLTKTEKNWTFSVLWIAPRQLHNQSKEKLEKIYTDNALECLSFEDIIENKLDENQILFLNWESINKVNNIYMKDNERDKTLTSIVENSRKENHKLILVIDESHFAAEGDRAKKILEDLNIDMTLNVSATPSIRSNYYYDVDHRDVINEGMIKEELVINPHFTEIKVDSDSVDELVIKQALQKRDELKEQFEAEGSDINPLMLIQLPNKSATNDDKRGQIVKILSDYNKTEKDGNLKTWLSEMKSDDLDSITKNDSDVDVLIFKHAISIGWDCPRAHVLVIFRDHMGFSFTIQTVGRIMRMPEHKHYINNPDLNIAYVFTNLDNPNIQGDFVKAYISTDTTCRDDELYDELKLKSTYVKNTRDRNRLYHDFVAIFYKQALEYQLKSKITLTPEKIMCSIPSDVEINVIDRADDLEYETIDVNMSDDDVSERLGTWVNRWCFPYDPKKSKHSMIDALCKFLNKECGMTLYSSKSLQVIIGKENIDKFKTVIVSAKTEYLKQFSNRQNEVETEITKSNWEIPKKLFFNPDINKPQNLSKSLHKPFVSNNASKLEIDFVKDLNESIRVKWWYKNGDSGKQHFSIKYVDDGLDRMFYVDFIVKFMDGSVGLFDTKGEWTAEIAEPKHNGLFRYIQTENKKGKNLIGGIVSRTEDKIWRYFDKEKYEFDENLINWKAVEI